MECGDNLFPKFMFSEDIDDTNNYGLIVSCGDRSSSRNTNADIPPVLLPLKPRNEMNVQAIKYGNIVIAV